MTYTNESDWRRPLSADIIRAHQSATRQLSPIKNIIIVTHKIFHPQINQKPKNMSSLAKQKRKAERAAKAGKKSGTSTPFSNGSATPLSNGSVEDLTTQLNGIKVGGGSTTVAPDAERSAVGVLASQPESRDIKIEQFNLSFHGRVLVENATIELNYGQRYGLLGANGSGKSTFLATLAAREVPIPDHIDVYLLKEEAEPSEMNALDYILAEAKKKVDELEADIEAMSMDPETLDEVKMQAKYDQLEELDASTFEAKASSILNGLGFSNEMMRKPTKDMSGGWRMRVTLGKPSLITSNIRPSTVHQTTLVVARRTHQPSRSRSSRVARSIPFEIPSLSRFDVPLARFPQQRL
jgi:ATP-binding cassette subfamily F protein 2